MISRISSFVKHPTSINVIINTAGTYLNIFFTALFAFILFRLLDPAQYGIYSVLLGIAYVLSNILDFGTTATIYSYLPTKIGNKTNELYVFIKSIFYYQTLFSGIVIGFLILFFPFLDQAFFKTGAPLWVLYLTALSTIFYIWQNFLQNCLFAAKKFLKANIYINIANVLKALVIFLLVSLKMVSVGSIIFVFGIVGPLTYFFLIFLERKNLIFRVLKTQASRREFRFRYTFTYFLASQLYNLSLRTDLFLLSYFRSKAEVGYYAAAQKIMLTIFSTMISVTQVLSPHFSSIKDRRELFSKLKTGLLYLIMPAALFLMTVFVPNRLYDLFFTKKFGMATISVIHWLSIPFIIITFSNLPSLFILYTIKKPKHLLAANFIQFIIMLIGCYIFIPLYGIFAPPLVLLAAFAVSGIYIVIASMLEYKRFNFSSNIHK